jgi:hypothetical protein
VPQNYIFVSFFENKLTFLDLSIIIESIDAEKGGPDKWL